MRRKIIISTAVSFFIWGVLGIPDTISQVVFGIMGAILCAIPLLVLSRCDFIKSSSKQVHTLVCVLVCMISILAVTCHMEWLKIKGQSQNENELWQRVEMLETQPSEAAQGGE
jgi:uncharacterized membrane protein